MSNLLFFLSSTLTPIFHVPEVLNVHMNEIYKKNN